MCVCVCVCVCMYVCMYLRLVSADRIETVTEVPDRM